MEPSPARIALKWGLLTALVKILMTSIRYAMGEFFSLKFPFLTLVIVTVGLVLALRELRAQNGGFMSFGEGISLALLMFAIVGLLNTTYTMVYNTLVNPNAFSQEFAQMREFFESYNLPDEQMEQMNEQFDAVADAQKQKGVSGSTFIGGILGWIFIGFLLSLPVSGIMSRKKTDPFA
ncbi:MAG: DUF4199 domain-containing protein [Cytophagales bacterium]|nr:MAG: DUF4199 domain-containing protein [Cytophagales bacterium]